MSVKNYIRSRRKNFTYKTIRNLLKVRSNLIFNENVNYYSCDYIYIYMPRC